MMKLLSLISIIFMGVATPVLGTQQPFSRSEFHTVRDYVNDIYKHGNNPTSTPNKKWFNTHKGAFGYVEYDAKKNNIVAAFRGTVNIINMMQNIKLDLVSYANCAGCRVHKGFMETYQSARNQVLASIINFRKTHPTAKIYVTGYSLGAAQAVYCTADLYKAGIQANLMTFGTPRPGNRNFANYINKIVTGLNYRIIYQSDKIPIILSKLMGFFNHGTEVNFWKSYFPRKQYKYKIYPKFQDNTNLFRLYNLIDHIRANYEKME